MSDPGGLQLIPGTKRKIDIHRPGENRLLYIGVAIVIALGGAWFVSYQYKASIQSKIEAADKKIAEIEIESRALRDEKQKIKILDSQLDVASELIANHVYWSKGFSIIENRMKSDSQAVSINASATTKSLKIKIKTRSYTGAARQIAAFLKESSIVDIIVSKITPGTDGSIEVDFDIKFNDKEFIRGAALTPTPRPNNPNT